uniref:Ubiquitin receptor RAD23 n=1 Tax=Brassica campestris TaxID=3711 RepID=M4CWQ2_BRACM
MKIFVKNLKGARFEIQVSPEDSVGDVKKNIETVMGVTAYPAAEQVLIHKGKVLKDETTLAANNVSEKSVIGVIKKKPASTGTSTAPASLTALVHAAHPSSTETETPVTPTEPAWDAASNGNYESISESNIQQILEMVRGAWSREAVAYALCLAYDDLNKALEYIYFGIPVKSEDHYTTEGTQEQTQEPAEADLEWSLDSLRHTPEDFLLMLKEQNPPFFQLIQDNKADFLRLLLEQPQEPNNGGDGGNQVGDSEETQVVQPPKELQADQTNEPNNGGGDGGNQVGESKETKVEVATPEDYELIERLEALGFERGDAAVAYFACNKNVQVAANHLLGYKHESRRE